jgi:hypothetical protein
MPEILPLQILGYLFHFEIKPLLGYEIKKLKNFCTFQHYLLFKFDRSKFTLWKGFNTVLTEEDIKDIDKFILARLATIGLYYRFEKRK